MLKKGLWIAAAMLMASTATAASAQQACDRACLGGVLDQFVAAVLAKDPGKAPLAYGFRQTANAVGTAAGAGIWQSLTAFGPVTRRYFDPVTGGAELFGVATDKGEPAVVSLRLKVEGRLITEAEWHVAHKGDAGIQGEPASVLFDPDKLAASPPPERVVAKAQRLPRETLVRVVNSYFDGITASDPKLVLAHPGCSRMENGLEVTGRPLRPGTEGQGFEGKGDCMTGYAGLNIANVAARRFLLVDEEAQVGIASAVVVRKPGVPRRRNYFMEAFTIDGGRIAHVHAAMLYADPTLPVPNWPPFDGNFPLAPALTPVK